MRFLPALLPLACLLQLPKVIGQDLQCPGQNTVEMRYCASLDLEDSNKHLSNQLPSGTFDRWKQITKEVCAKAYAPYKQGTIYPQMVVRCDDNLNPALRQALKGLGEN